MCLRGFFEKQRYAVDGQVNLYRSPDLVSKLMVVFVTGMLLLGWTFILQAHGSQPRYLFFRLMEVLDIFLNSHILNQQ